MSDIIQQARIVLSKWRSGMWAAPLPWSAEHVDPKNPGLADILRDADGDAIFEHEVDDRETAVRRYEGESDPAIVRLIAGTAGNPALWDAIDEMLAVHEVPRYMIPSSVQRIAEAIVEADARMSA